MSESTVKYLLLNPFGFTQRSFATADELEAHIVNRFGSTDPESMHGHTGVRRTYRTESNQEVA
ncbi:hypothetical protein ACIGKR_30015 [Rhodococcus qingshengii]|uniref:hypothetical protein n=1 Tax=Rhodococcus qingshengii TaxID=334542 RepID=UPI0037C8E740